MGETVTRRDAVWKAALLRTYKNDEAVTAEEIADSADTSVRTARSTLTVMADGGFLIKERIGRGTRYRRGEALQ